MKKSLYIFIAVVLLLVVVVLIGYRSNNPKSSELSATSQPSTLGITAKVGPDSLYPNPAITPGEIFPNVTTQEVCTPGYSSSVRNVPVSEKEEVFSEYGISYPVPTGSYEVDHFISLELGGDNSIQNLWPEPASPVPGFHQKDVVENYLHKEVCNGTISITEAQNEIKTDWYKVYQNINK